MGLPVAEPAFGGGTSDIRAGRQPPSLAAHAMAIVKAPPMTAAAALQPSPGRVSLGPRSRRSRGVQASQTTPTCSRFEALRGDSRRSRAVCTEAPRARTALGADVPLLLHLSLPNAARLQPNRLGHLCAVSRERAVPAAQRRARPGVVWRGGFRGPGEDQQDDCLKAYLLAGAMRFGP